MRVVRTPRSAPVRHSPSTNLTVTTQPSAFLLAQVVRVRASPVAGLARNAAAHISRQGFGHRKGATWGRSYNPSRVAPRSTLAPASRRRREGADERREHLAQFPGPIGIEAAVGVPLEQPASRVELAGLHHPQPGRGSVDGRVDHRGHRHRRRHYWRRRRRWCCHWRRRCWRRGRGRRHGTHGQGSGRRRCSGHGSRRRRSGGRWSC